MKILKCIYKVFRSIIMTLIVFLVVLYVVLYVVLSVPSVQDKVKVKVCSELSSVLGGRLEVDDLAVSPFSEVMLTGVSLHSPQGGRCVSIGKVAAGIDIWSLFLDRRIVLNYAEVIGLDVKVVKESEDSPLNIQFLIDALSPKDKDKPKAKFDLKIRNIVVRKSKATFTRQWLAGSAASGQGPAEMSVDGLRMDLSIPELREDLYRFDVRNVQFEATPGIDVRSLSAHVAVVKDTTGRGSDRVQVSDLLIGFPKSSLSVGDVDLKLNSPLDVKAIVRGRLTPSDFSAFWQGLETFDTPWNIDVDASIKESGIVVSGFSLSHASSDSFLSLNGEAHGIRSKDSLDIELRHLELDLSPVLISDAVAMVPSVGGRVKDMLKAAGRVKVGLQGGVAPGGSATAEGSVATSIGHLDFSAKATHLYSKRPQVRLLAEAEDVAVDMLLATGVVGKVSADIEAEITGLDRNAEGYVRLKSDECVLAGNLLNMLDLGIEKAGNRVDVNLEASSQEMSVSLDGMALLDGAGSRLEADMSLSGFNPSGFGLKGRMADCDISSDIAVYAEGDDIDNVCGWLDLTGLSIKRSDGGKLSLPKLSVYVDRLEADSIGEGHSLARDIQVRSEWLDAHIRGCLHPRSIAAELKGMVGEVLPTLIPSASEFSRGTQGENDFEFDIKVKGASAPYAYFDTPVRPLTDIPISGHVDTRHGRASLEVSTPHLQQGRSKLIRDVAVKAELDAFLGMAKMNAGLIFPAKKGEAQLVADVYAVHDKVTLDVGINPDLTSVVKGSIGLEATFSRQPDPFSHSGSLAARVDLKPSAISVNDMVWTIADGSVDYSGKRISIGNFLVSHADQYVKIDGTASEDPEDRLKVKLNDIDLEYIFNILDINYVSFGGMATGEVVGSRLLTKDPEAKTQFLRVRGLSYNGAVLGDGDLASEYDASARKVGIYAVIRDPLTRQRRVSVDGGIWVTRDSLSFGFDADKVNVSIMKPFVSAFCSDLYGSASGRCKLYGTFSDIDLVGDLKADTLSMKLDFTNTWYHAGNDSVFLRKGVIDIPPLTLYDDDGHTAEFSGWLKHTYFHNPTFNFRLRDARSLLCYNTNERLNPLWYGTIYGSGNAQINGSPGVIDIDMNMTTEEGSKFYYVINDAEDVAEYSFLTFTDRRKQHQAAATVDSVPDYLARFRKQTSELETGSSNVILSIKGTVTNDALVTLVMDPRAGDNITARGQGALQMDYNLASNDLRMIGTYVLDEGSYNFTLQDIIIKNFTIKKGSLIKFDGDPMKANLDIAATYRVNTNLTDLDKSFSTDKELNRTNVPVDAVLLVDGPMTNPDISFDIELPSLTSDVERKVKSIVSTNDMMSRQIIYLLALNRFYTPEYTGGQSNGSEWSSMASSTISSQLSNILSQMTDKLDVAPSFRSEKGDFSDMEFDLALSSRLLNNRLLINGNFGYRDRSTSNTQFVGDFDIEYLLSKNGNLRLKAYNHFNDQNYYLRSALTTQGVGVVFRKDFDRLFRRRKKEEGKDGVQPSDSVAEGKDHMVKESIHAAEDSVGKENNKTKRQ